MLPGAYSSRFRDLEREHYFMASEQREYEKNDTLARNKRLSAETNKRRKALANKRKHEAEKEEKRRQEILAKRREQQKLATERFQRAHIARRIDSQDPYEKSNSIRAPALEEALKAIQGSISVRTNEVAFHPDMSSGQSYYRKYGAYVAQRTPDRARQHMQEIAARTELHNRSLRSLNDSKSLFEKQLEEQQQQLKEHHKKSLHDFNAAIMNEIQTVQSDLQKSSESLSSTDSLDDTSKQEQRTNDCELESVVSDVQEEVAYNKHDMPSSHNKVSNYLFENNQLVSDLHSSSRGHALNESYTLSEGHVKSNQESKTVYKQENNISNQKTNFEDSSDYMKENDASLRLRTQAKSAYSQLNQNSSDYQQPSRQDVSSYQTTVGKVDPHNIINQKTQKYNSGTNATGAFQNKAWTTATMDNSVSSQNDNKMQSAHTKAQLHTRTHNARTTATPITSGSAQSPYRRISSQPERLIHANGNHVSNQSENITQSNGNQVNLAAGDCNSQVCAEKLTNSENKVHGYNHQAATLSTGTLYEKTYSTPSKLPITAITKSIHKVHSAPIIAQNGYNDIKSEDDAEEVLSTQSAPDTQEVKGILKSQKDINTRTVFTRGHSSPDIRDSLDINREKLQKRKHGGKKSVRFADLTYSDESGEESIEQIAYKPPVPKPRVSLSTNKTIDRKPPRPVSAKVPLCSNKEAVSVTRSASAGSVRPGPKLRPKAVIQNTNTTQRTVIQGQEAWNDTQPHQNGQNTNNKYPVSFDENGVRLDKTPTDDEINWLWDKVRTCLNRSTSSAGSIETQAQAPQQVSVSTRYIDGSNLDTQVPASINNTFPRRQTPNDGGGQRSNALLQQRRQQPAATINSYRLPQTNQRPAQSNQTPVFSSHNQEVSESMAAFLTAEVLTQQSISENDIQTAMDAAQSRQKVYNGGRPSHHTQTALSVEEQRLLQSLDRLNDRLRVTELSSTGPRKPNQQELEEDCSTNAAGKNRQISLHQRTHSDNMNSRNNRNHHRIGSATLPSRTYKY